MDKWLSPKDLVADRFEVIALLGGGGMGQVYSATDRSIGRAVALKVADPNTVNDPAKRWVFMERFKREAQIGDLLSRGSGGYARVFQVGTHESGSRKLVYMATDLFEGVTLKAALRAADSHDRLQHLHTVELLAGLVADAHRNGVVHRDVKPENVVIGRMGTVHLIDFGIAKRAWESGSDEYEATMEEIRTQLTKPETGMGTPLYMAPEQFEAASTAGPKADVFAVGWILYEVLTGDHLLRGRGGPVQINAFYSDAQRVRSELEAGLAESRSDLRELCLEALAVDPAKRPSAEGMANRMRLARHHDEAGDVTETVTADTLLLPPPSVPSSTVMGKQQPSFGTPLAVLAIVLGGCGIFLPARGDPPRIEAEPTPAPSHLQAPLPRIPVGAVISWPFSIKAKKDGTPDRADLPNGWLLCDGSEIAEGRYGRLYRELLKRQFPYGKGDPDKVGKVKAKLPNYTGVFIRGADLNGVVDKAPREPSRDVGSHQPAQLPGRFAAERLHFSPGNGQGGFRILNTFDGLLTRPWNGTEHPPDYPDWHGIKKTDLGRSGTALQLHPENVSVHFLIYAGARATK